MIIFPLRNATRSQLPCGGFPADVAIGAGPFRRRNASSLFNRVTSVLKGVSPHTALRRGGGVQRIQPREQQNDEDPNEVFHGCSRPFD